MKTFGGPVLFLDRSDINTDEILPARYLTEVTKEALKPFLLEDLKVEGFEPKSERTARARVIVTRANFGCGSSREHAPWALEVNDITLVIAENFARIFRQNMFNCGMMAVELPKESIDGLFFYGNGEEIICEVNVDEKRLTFTGRGQETVRIEFTLSKFDETLIHAGGWVEYADTHY